MLSTPGNTLFLTLYQEKNTCLIKLEGTNPSGSIKYRLAYAAVTGAIERSELRKGQTIIEVSSGNTGIALALIGKEIGCPVTIILPENAHSVARIQKLGAQVLLLPAAKGLPFAFEKAEELVASGCFWPNQYKARPGAYKGLCSELARDIPNLSYAVASVGTGGTIMGLAGLPVSLVAVEAEDPIEGMRLQGMSLSCDAYDRAVPSRIITVSSRQAALGLDFLREHGICASLSSGAVAHAALTLEEEVEAQHIALISPDGVLA